MNPLLKYWALVLGAVAALGFGTRCVMAIQQHLDDDVRRDERIRVLEAIAISEHPAYSPMIFFKEK